jgi:antiviral helicase SKI2
MLYTVECYAILCVLSLLLCCRRARLRSKIDHVRHVLSNERLQLFPDFQQRLGVLRALGYVASDATTAAAATATGDSSGKGSDTVQLKGRVACEVNTADELITTEIVFENVLQHLDPPEIAGTYFTYNSVC